MEAQALQGDALFCIFWCFDDMDDMNNIASNNAALLQDLGSGGTRK